MAKRVELPDGSIGEFPDTMGDEDIKTVLRRKFPPPAPAAAPTPPGQIPTNAVYDRAPPATDPRQRYGDRSTSDQISGGIASTLNRAAIGLKGLLPGVETTDDDRRRVEQHREFVKGTGPASTLAEVGTDMLLAFTPMAKAGRLAQALRGGKAGAGAAAIPVAADIAANAGYNAATAPEDRGVAAAWGGGGAAVAPVLSRTLGGLRPIMSKDVGALSDAGVSLTPGQMIPGLRGIEDRMTSIPLVGDIIKSARNRSMSDFGRAEINAALAPLGKSVKGSGADAVDMASRHVSDAYEGALRHISVTPAKAKNAIGETLSELEGLPLLDPKQMQQVHSYWALRVNPILDGATLPMSGPQVKRIDTEIGHYARKYISSPNPADHPLGEAFYILQSNWRDAMTAPAGSKALATLNSANAAHKGLLPITIAAERNPHGVFSPSVLKQSVSRLRNSEGPTRLTEAAARVLPSTVPDSGSAGRMLQGAMMGGAAGFATGTTPHLAAGVAITAGTYSELALKVIAGSTQLQQKFRAMSAPEARLALEQLGRAIAAQQAQPQGR